MIDVPRPTIGPTEVLVRTVASVMSPGTERAVARLAQSNLANKARARPDLVREVLRKARRDGVAATARAVRARLDEDVPLGYSAAGIAVEVGEVVEGVAPGQLVATGGAGKANHAEYQAVPGLLCAAVPDGVTAERAAFATLASVALHGVRLAEVGPGDRLVVVGLGLVGQLAVRLARAAGCEVVGLDIADGPVPRASQGGGLGLVDNGEETTKAVLEWSRGRGADAVLVAAATPSSDVMRRVPELCRDRANVVVVGDVGLELDRRPLYERELTLRFARSYGPGRYERAYEDWAVDYPAGLVRWTEGRNLEAVLDLLASDRLSVDDLVTHRVPIADAAQAYERLLGGEPAMAVVFSYPTATATSPAEGPIPVSPRRRSTSGEPGVGLIGAGAFASTVLVPGLKAAGFTRMVAVASASGLTSRRLAERAGFERAVSGASAVIDDPEVEVVVIATPHDSHAALAAQALRAGKHVFCEKPLALTDEEVDDVEEAWRSGEGVLFVGFNRRWSPAVAAVRSQLGAGGGAGPLVITYRVNAGGLPARHWYNDRRQGGRLLGEVCHFVDTCAAIVGSAAGAADVRAVGSGRGERLLSQDLVVTLRYPDGSLATISYATGGHASTEKERVEVLGGGHSALIVDFREVVFDGRPLSLPARPGKGHGDELAAFRVALSDGGRGLTEAALATTRTTLQAAAALTNASDG